MLKKIVIGVVVGVVAVACTSDDVDPSGPVGTGGKGGGGGASASGGTSGASGTGATGASSTGGTAGIGEGGDGGDAGTSSGATGGIGGTVASGGTGGSSGTGGGGGTGGSGGSGGTSGSGGSGGTSGTCTSPSGKGPCDTIPQCGCLANQNCDVTAADGTTECVAAGTVSPWHACSEYGECAKGYTCVGGVCSAFCESATSVCPGTNARCLQPTVDGFGIPGMYVCTRTCSPVDPSLDDATFDACGAGLGCYPSRTSNSYCYGPTGTGTHLANCADLSGNPDDSQCAPGYVCSSSLVCLKYCLMESAVCPSGAQCFNFNPVLFAGNKSIGYCS